MIKMKKLIVVRTPQEYFKVNKKMKPKKSKSQVDVAITIGAIIIPMAAMFGSLVFAFVIIAEMGNAAQLAGVIMHDITSLIDVAYSVPDDIKINYKPPYLCKFIDIDSPNAGCTCVIPDCSKFTDSTTCNSRSQTCEWSSGSCKNIDCSILSENNCKSHPGLCFWDSSQCKLKEDFVITSCSSDKTSSSCKSACTSEEGKNYNCRWEEPKKTAISCLPDDYLIIRGPFKINVHSETFKFFDNEKEILMPFTASPSFYISLREGLDYPAQQPFKVSATNFFVDLMDFDLYSGLNIPVENGVIISKQRKEIYDTLSNSNSNYRDSLYQVVDFLVNKCNNNELGTTTKTYKKSISAPAYFGLNWSSDTKLCLVKYYPNYSWVYREYKNASTYVYCFDFNNDFKGNCSFTKSSDIELNTNYYLTKNYIVNVTYTKCIDSQCKAPYNAKVNITEVTK